MINVTQTFLPPLEEYIENLASAWDAKWLTNRGRLVKELEEKIAVHLGIQDILLVNNGTIALQIAIKALGLSGEIITTPFSYVATVSSIVWENCTPVFVDIDKDYLTIDETAIEAAITESTTAILATHVYGFPCNVEVIAAIAQKHNLRVIYDAAHCFDVKYKGKSLLDYGDVSTLSFHATKLFHTGEGGAIVCNDPDIAAKIFFHHNFGHHGEEEFYGLGINGKLSELNAAMGLAVLPYVDQIILKRKHLCDTYDNFLAGADLQERMLRAGTVWNYSYYPVIFPSEENLLRVKTRLNEQSVFPRRYFFPSLNRLPYVSYQSAPIAERISRTVLCLPLYAGLEDSEIEAICKTITENG